MLPRIGFEGLPRVDREATHRKVIQGPVRARSQWAEIVAAAGRENPLRENFLECQARAGFTFLRWRGGRVAEGAGLLNGGNIFFSINSGISKI